MSGTKNRKTLTVINQSAAAIANFLENVLKQPVIDETGLNGRYDFELRSDFSDPDKTIAAIREQFGFEISTATRLIEVLVVEK